MVLGSYCLARAKGKGSQAAARSEGRRPLRWELADIEAGFSGSFSSPSLPPARLLANYIHRGHNVLETLTIFIDYLLTVFLVY